MTLDSAVPKQGERAPVSQWAELAPPFNSVSVSLSDAKPDLSLRSTEEPTRQHREDVQRTLGARAAALRTLVRLGRADEADKRLLAEIQKELEAWSLLEVEEMKQNTAPIWEDLASLAARVMATAQRSTPR